MPAITFEITAGRRVMAALAWLAAGLAGVVAPYARAGDRAELGVVAPALIARSFEGATIDLQALRGEVVVLNFWASWCGPCRSEMPMLDALAREYRNRGVTFLGLSADDRHDRKEALRAARSVGYLTGLLADAQANGFGAPSVLPLTYIIARDGKLSGVLHANEGPMTAGRLRATIEAELARAPPVDTMP